MNKKILVLIIGISLLLGIFSFIIFNGKSFEFSQKKFSRNQESYKSEVLFPTIHDPDGSAYAENQYGKIYVENDVSYGIFTQTHYLNLSWYGSPTDLDIAFKLSLDADALMSNKKIFLWTNFTHEKITPIYGEIEYSYFNNQSQEIFYNITEQIGETIENIPYEDWKDIGGILNQQTYNNNKYYFKKNIAFTTNETKQIKIQYKTPRGTNGKFDIYMKRSADTIQQALTHDRYLLLDPVWSDSFESGLWAYFSLNETSGDFIDVMGNTTATQYSFVDPTKSRGTTIAADNLAVNFTKDAHDQLNISSFPTSLSEFSINFWVYNTDWTTPDDYIISWDTCDSTATRDFHLKTASGHFKVTLGGDSVTLNQNIAGGSPSTNSWQMITFTYDGATASLYINGSKRDTFANTGSINVNDQLMSLGNECETANFAAMLYMDEFMFYTKNLSDTFINDLYNGGSGTFYASLDNFPSITNVNEFPSDPVNYNPNQLYSFNATITDDLSLDTVLFEFDNINYTSVNTVGNVYNVTIPFVISAGTHNYKWIANDSANQWANYSSDYTINKLNATPTLYLNSVESNLSITFPSEVNASANTSISEQTLILYRDGINVNSENGLFKKLSASSDAYNYTAIAQSSQNYTWRSITKWVAISKNSSIMNLTVNESDSNITLEAGSTIPINATIVEGFIGGGNINLTEDGVQINFSSTNNISHKRTFNNIGDFNITAIYSGNENYTGSSETHFIKVVDTTPPQINIDAPFNTMNIGQVGFEEYINWTLIGGSDTCWIEYNGINTTKPCADSNATFILQQDIYNITIWANDSSNNIAGNTSNWAYYAVQLNQSYNNISIESTNEQFISHFKLNSSLDSANLIYNGTSNSGTVESIGGGIYKITSSSNIPLVSADLNYSFFWNLHRDDSIIVNSSIKNQEADNLYFAQCNSTISNSYLNISFKDETNNSIINGTISSGTFIYWVNESSLNQTYSFTNSSEILNFDFCAEPSYSSFNMDYLVQYESTNYPQRIFDPSTSFFSNSSTQKTLYLLNSNDGIYVSFQLINIAQQTLEGVVVSVNTTISGDDVEISKGITDIAGLVTFWLNPDTSYKFSFDGSGIGYPSIINSIYPTQSSYTITLGASSTTIYDFGKGIDYNVAPNQKNLFNQTQYSFGFNLTSDYWTVDEFGFVLFNSTGDEINSSRIYTSGGSSLVYHNVNNDTLITMKAYYVIGGGNYTNITKSWIVLSSSGTGFGIVTFSNRLTSYTSSSSGLFGLDNFGLAIISFLFIFIITGVVSYKYGITSPAALSALVFSLVLFLDVGLGVLDGVRMGSSNLPIATIFVGIIIFIAGILREVYR